MHEILFDAEQANAASPLRGSAVQALHDFGLPGIVLLILASGVLIYAFTRNVRLAISATLAGSFMLVASGWVFQLARAPQTAMVELPQGGTVQVWPEEPRHQIEIPPAAAAPSEGLLKLTLATESPDLVIYTVAGSQRAEAAAAIDQLVGAAGQGYKFSAAHAGDQRIYTRTQTDQTLRSFTLTPRSVELQFAKPPTKEQLAAIDAVIEPLAETWKLTQKSGWTGQGTIRTQQLASQGSDATSLASGSMASGSSATRANGNVAVDDAVNVAVDDKLWLATARAASRGASPGKPASQEWIRMADQPGRMVEGAYVKVASSGRFLLAHECQPSLQAAIANEVRNYVGLRLGTKAEQRIDVPREWIESHVVKAGPLEQDVASATVDGGGKRLHALLVFDQRAQEDLKAMLRDRQVQNRSLFAMLVLGGLVSVFGGVFGYLKVDTATKGYYSARLKFALAATLFLVSAAIVWAVRSDLFW